MKIEREKIEFEIESFRKEEETKQKRYENEILADKSAEQARLKEHKSEIDKIQSDFTLNSKSAVEYLVNACLEVDLKIPDVIIGRFAHKLLK